MKKILSIVSVLILLGVVAFLWIDWNLEHVVNEVVTSPSGNHIATAYFLGKGGNPPYGESVEIYSGWNPLGRYLGEAVLAGYCKGKVSLRWQNEHELTIQCSEPESISVKRGELGDIKINIIQ